MKEVPKKDAPEVSGGVIGDGLVIPGYPSPYPMPPYNPGGPTRPLIEDPMFPQLK
jgi:hypothetical protein